MGKKVVAEVCLYGASHCGHGYLALGPAALKGGKTVSDGKMFGDGEPKEGRSATEAYWLGVKDLLDAGLDRKAIVRVFMPGGERCADVVAGSSCLPYFGELKWKSAPIYVISPSGVK